MLTLRRLTLLKFSLLAKPARATAEKPLLLLTDRETQTGGGQKQPERHRLHIRYILHISTAISSVSRFFCCTQKHLQKFILPSQPLCPSLTLLLFDSLALQHADIEPLLCVFVSDILSRGQHLQGVPGRLHVPGWTHRPLVLHHR